MLNYQRVLIASSPNLVLIIPFRPGEGLQRGRASPGGGGDFPQGQGWVSWKTNGWSVVILRGLHGISGSSMVF